jgi:sodium transport system permease protein
MNWRNVRLIYAREIRDQLRDRRTLFMIAVLPLLLYPLLGMSVFQVSQFLRKSEPRVLVIGSRQLAQDAHLPPLFANGRFASGLFDDPAEAERLHVVFADEWPPGPLREGNGKHPQPKPLSATADLRPEGEEAGDDEAALRAAREQLKSGVVQVVLNFPAGFGERLSQLREQASADGTDRRSAKAQSPPSSDDMPRPELLSNLAREKSRVARMQVESLLNVWKSQVVRENLAASRVPVSVSRPFELQLLDVAEQRQQQAAMWAKVLPFVLFIWALTGAFYPAVDLCAGEKERGTLETLLSSPALRTEIVWGKLFTVMTFSTVTALLNLVSLGVTAQYVISQLQMLPAARISEGVNLPPLLACLWLLAALVPMSALFSALCLACAAFARSTKEGQYYLMPLLLVMMPLMMLPMSPGAELDLGNSLIPVAGVVLLLRGLVEGNYGEVLPYIVPVCGITLICCLLAIRWAVYQFNQESVLFRESERLDLRRWLVHLVRDRKELPSLGEALFCVVVIYVIQFFTRLAISANVPASPDFRFVTLLFFISQVVCIALPALMMTLLFTSRPFKTLLLDRPPRVMACIAAVPLAILLHPLGLQLIHWIREVYPIQQQVLNDTEQIGRLFKTAPYVWLPYVLIAVLPAFCEEVAFRGFILSGLRHLGKKWWAIGLSAVFFGIAHTVVQQSIAAAALGVVLAYLAVQSGSLVPCMLFHFTYNSLMFGTLQLADLGDRWPVLKSLMQEEATGEMLYRWPVVVIGGVLAAGLLAWFHRMPHRVTQEEYLDEVRARQGQQPLAGGATTE